MLLRRYHEDTEPDPDTEPGAEPDPTKTAPPAEKPAGRTTSKAKPKG
ncbi:hypothetical protein ACFWXZ_14475 [[Kitasatospora] papulosa]